jgi:cold shock protein
LARPGWGAIKGAPHIKHDGIQSLNEGQKVSYDLVADRRTGKSSADILKVA